MNKKNLQVRIESLTTNTASGIPAYVFSFSGNGGKSLVLITEAVILTIFDRKVYDGQRGARLIEWIAAAFRWKYAFSQFAP